MKILDVLRVYEIKQLKITKVRLTQNMLSHASRAKNASINIGKRPFDFF